ncbi:hypothetical protein [Erythrobacter aureus]|uniref:Uncharacterized protein n=1 Tax=Erythrobacter aureus TaxID=2182384 RepID=A0A345YIJ7_9SPHN|nr:hypothetical protein [Erythrobacter aureus]AXK43749.1 hypothetical protein DVR09_14930 [Erythrobacter aureus]
MPALAPNSNIGSRHGEMHSLVKNPFKADFMRRNFDAAIQTYDTKHRNFIHPSGIRCKGNGWAVHFWRGFDQVDLDYTGLRDSAAYAMYRAGKAIGKALEKEAVTSPQ